MTRWLVLLEPRTEVPTRALYRLGFTVFLKKIKSYNSQSCYNILGDNFFLNNFFCEIRICGWNIIR